MKRSCIIIALLIGLSACAVTTPPAPPEFYTHEVSFAGETLAMIARWYTGDADNWEVIHQHNQDIEVRKMLLGSKILIPIEIS